MVFQDYNIEVEQPTAVGYIYKITNRLSDMAYIGQTKRKVEERLLEHLTGSGSQYLLKDIVINGIQAFKFEIVEVIYDSECDIDAKEDKYIIQHDTIHPRGFNLRLNKEIEPNDDEIDLQNLEIECKFCFTDEENYRCFSIGEFTLCRNYQTLLNVLQATSTSKIVKKRKFGFQYLQLKVKDDKETYVKNHIYHLSLRYDSEADEFVI